MPVFASPELIKKQRILERYSQENPAADEFRVWVELTAKEFDVSEFRVKQWVGEYTQWFLSGIKSHMQTHAQRTAEVMGADLALAMDQLRQALTATKKRAVVIGKGEDQRIEYYEDPDWGSRNTAIKLAFALYGAEAPKQIEIHSTNQNFNFSDEELTRQLSELTNQIAAYLPGSSSKTAKGASSQRGIESAESGKGLLLLDDGSNQDGRRTESRTVQAVPEGTVHKKPRGRPRKRASAAD